MFTNNRFKLRDEADTLGDWIAHMVEVMDVPYLLSLEKGKALPKSEKDIIAEIIADEVYDFLNEREGV